jgi:hypothetical protein
LEVAAWFALALADPEAWLRWRLNADGSSGDAASTAEPRVIDWAFWGKLLTQQVCACTTHLTFRPVEYSSERSFYYKNFLSLKSRHHKYSLLTAGRICI